MSTQLPRRAPAFFPNVSTFGALFLSATPDKSAAPAEYRWRFEDVDFYVSKKYAHSVRVNVESVSISPFLTVEFVGDDGGRRDWRTLYAQPTRALVEAVKRHMLPIKYDTIYFKAYIFDSGRVNIHAQYNQIIGSRLVASFDADDLDAPATISGGRLLSSPLARQAHLLDAPRWLWRADVPTAWTPAAPSRITPHAFDAYGAAVALSTLRDYHAGRLTLRDYHAGRLTPAPDLDGVTACGQYVCKKCRRLVTQSDGHTAGECAAEAAELAQRVFNLAQARRSRQLAHVQPLA